ncbi:MAG: hypothetical protein U9Q06_00570 [Nanoarchaeota archaeon]|nr:hypothetical protein [Nanoarchaeota archaeon]
MFNDTKIKEKIEIEKFLKILSKYSEEKIECTDHTFFRLSEAQRKFYTCEELKRILIQQKPFLVGLQYNENYALFYKYNNRNLKILVNLDITKIKIVTFYFIQEWQIPKI